MPSRKDFLTQVNVPSELNVLAWSSTIGKCPRTGECPNGGEYPGLHEGPAYPNIQFTRPTRKSSLLDYPAYTNVPLFSVESFWWESCDDIAVNVLLPYLYT